jgi:NADPH:quinone reductase-like Zn-dependent oxidoreductase
MRTLRFHSYGDPADVLRLEDAEVPTPGPGQIRIAVRACGLTPADWALCTGLFGGELPRGIGLEVAGIIDAIGEGAAAHVGDPVCGPAPFRGPTAGASEYALLDIWVPRRPGLDPVDAAALPMAVETAYRGLADLDVQPGRTVLVNGAGTTVGYAAVQIAGRLGARVIATAGETYAEALRATGALVTGYGNGLAERVRALAGGPVDLVLDTAPPSNALPALIEASGSPRQVVTLTDFGAAKALGVRGGIDGSATLRYDVLGEFADLAAEGRFAIPIGGVYPFDDWRTAMERSRSGHAHGKLVLTF